MTTFGITDHQLQRECETLAKGIFDECTEDMNLLGETPDDYRDDMFDRAHDFADGHPWVIYTYKAIVICAHCNVDRGEEFIEDVGIAEPVTFGGLATQIVYGEMRARIEECIQGLVDDWEPVDDRESAD